MNIKKIIERLKELDENLRSLPVVSFSMGCKEGGDILEITLWDEKNNRNILIRL